MPPNYDEIDPPPSYSTLFPGNKTYETESSSNANTSNDHHQHQHHSNDVNTINPNPCTLPLNNSGLTAIVHSDSTINVLHGQQQQPSAPALPSSSSQS